MRIPIFGTGTASGQKQVTVRKTVGMYWERRGETEKAPMVAVPFPGTATVVATGVAASLRAVYASYLLSGIVYFIAGNKAYRYIEGGTVDELGEVNDGPAYLWRYIADLPNIQLFCSGTKLYRYISSTWAEQTPPFNIGSILTCGGYFVATERNGGRFALSTDGATWADIATAESLGDNLTGALNRDGELILVGEGSMEFWSHTGDSDFPFARVAATSVGTAYQRSMCMVGGAAYMVAGAAIGTSTSAPNIPPAVIRLNGYSPEVISTPDVDRIIGTWAPSRTIGYGFTLGGKPMLMLSDASGGAAGLLYDAATGLWTELSATTANKISIGCAHPYHGMIAGGLSPALLVNLDASAHNNDTRQIITDHVVSPDGERFTVDSLRLDMATNVDVAEKQVGLKVSRDGGLTWGASQSVGLGTTSGPQKKVEFRRLGRARSFTFDLDFPTDVPITVHSASLNASD